MGEGRLDAQMQELKEYYGFDKPAIIAYFNWLGKLVQGIWVPRPGTRIQFGVRSRAVSHFAFHGVTTTTVVSP